MQFPLPIRFALIEDSLYFFNLDTMFPCDDEGYYSYDKESHYVETWKAMEKLVDSGKAKTIGLSNFNKSQIIGKSNY